MSFLRFKVLTFDVAGTPIDCRRGVPDYLHEVASDANVSDRDFLSAYREVDRVVRGPATSQHLPDGGQAGAARLALRDATRCGRRGGIRSDAARWVTASGPISLLRDETQRIRALVEGLAQDDPAAELLDPDIVLQQALHEVLEAGDTRGHDLQEVVVAPTDVVALENLAVPGSGLFELAEVVAPVAADRHLAKHDDVAAQLLERDVGAVPADHAEFLQPFGPYEARALAQADGVSELDVRAASLALEVRKDLEVELVDVNSAHGPMVALESDAVTARWHPALRTGIRPAPG